MKDKLTKKETREDVNKTIGRLRMAIICKSQDRQQALLEKISQDVCKMEIELSHYKLQQPI